MKLSKNAQHLLNIIKNNYSGIATRNNLEWECGKDEMKKLSSILSELKRKGFIDIFNSIDPMDRRIYKIK